jgi:hypothetical protein
MEGREFLILTHLSRSLGMSIVFSFPRLQLIITAQSQQFLSILRLIPPPVTNRYWYHIVWNENDLICITDMSSRVQVAG